MIRAKHLLASAVIGLVLLGTARAEANPWTRDQGKFYLNLNYSFILADRFFDNKFQSTALGNEYRQHVLGFYGEVGLVSRWLTARVEMALMRYSELASQGAVYGLGDLRIGLFSGLVAKPVRLAIGVVVGFPTGDPVTRVQGDPIASIIAQSLPTGDGEFDADFVVSFGYAFGGWKKYPLKHYVVAQLSYWLRTTPRDTYDAAPARVDLPDAITWKLELGTKFPWKFIERFWFIFRLYGVESLQGSCVREDPNNPGIDILDPECAASGSSGLGGAVTYASYSLEIFMRIYQGLGASFSAAGAFRARLVPAAPQFTFAVSYER